MDIMIRFMRFLMFVAIVWLSSFELLAQSKVAEIFSRANDGDPKAQYILGLSYMDGENGITKPDSLQAIYWWKLASDNGHSAAQVALGYRFYTKNDYNNAFKYWKLAADQNNNTALRNIGILYLNGEGVESSDELAYQYFYKSAQFGNASSQIDIADKALAKRDSISAMFWYNAVLDINAHNNVDTEKKALDKLKALSTIKNEYRYKALFYIGDYYSYREEFSEAEKYFKDAVSEGSIEAMAGLGSMYERIDRIKAGDEIYVVNEEESKSNDQSAVQRYMQNNTRGSNDNAAYWYELAVKYGADEWIYEGSHLLYWFLYRTYLNGWGVSKDFVKAAHNLDEFIKKGGIFDCTEYCRLGDLYSLGGNGLEQDFNKAISCYQKSIELYEADGWALTGIGRCWYFCKAYEMAVKYFQLASEGDYITAEPMRFLSRCYRYGRGVKQDETKAEYWHRKALEEEDPEAMALAKLIGDN